MLCARTGISLTMELASINDKKVRTSRMRGLGIIGTIFADLSTILPVLNFEGYDEVTSRIRTERFITWDEWLENGSDWRDQCHSRLAKGHLKLVR